MYQKPVSSNATQLIAAEITKETGALSEIEKTKEANTIRVKAIEAKIREVGAKYNEKVSMTSRVVLTLPLLKYFHSFF